MTSTTFGWTFSAGVVPAERASGRPRAAAVKSASAICERPAFWTQTKRTRLRSVRAPSVHGLTAALEQEHVAPLAVQLAEAPAPADDLEADPLVQADAGFVLGEHAGLDR